MFFPKYPLLAPSTYSALAVMTMSSIVCVIANAQDVPPANYDEAKVQVLHLPELLVDQQGKEISTSQAWVAHRPYVLNQLAEYEYGFAPTEEATTKIAVVHEGTIGESKVRFRELDLTIAANGKEQVLHLVMFLPAASGELQGVFLMPNFNGNHTLTNDPQIRIAKSWVHNDGDKVKDHQATEATRGSAAQRAPIELITDRGYALVSVCYGDIDPDFDDNFENGVHALFPNHKPDSANPARWGSIAAWAWGLSRCLDELLKMPEVAPERVAVIGHSRLGKTALWAGASDERFSIVYSNNSGCGGAALCRRNFGETVWRINTSFPHWFNDNFPKYNQDPSQLPIDQHMLIAAIAPRPIYVASATKDQWADPKGEYTSAYLANQVYELFGKKGLPSPQMPAAGESVGETIGYHLREGVHDLLAEDWQHYLDFADRHWHQK